MDANGVLANLYDPATNALRVTAAATANMAQSRIKGRAAAAGTGAPQDLTAAQVKTILAYLASDVAVTPTGAIVATDVQAALAAIDTRVTSVNSFNSALVAQSLR